MICSFCGLHEAGSKCAAPGAGLCGGTIFELAEALFECRRFVPSFIFVTSPKGSVPLIGGSDLRLFVDAIQVSSGRGFRIDFDGSLWRPFAMPTELERSGMAFGEIGFSPTICVVAVGLGNMRRLGIIEVCAKGVQFQRRLEHAGDTGVEGL
jgi:hypothetical protein